VVQAAVDQDPVEPRRELRLPRERAGRFVEADRITELLDFLSPRYVKSPQRVDLWGKELEYQGSATSYRLISYGPDRKSGTKDDLIIENGALKTGAN